MRGPKAPRAKKRLGHRTMTPDELKSFLDEKAVLYNRPDFIASDPIQIPHRYSLKEDIEVSGFLTATIAWGNRKAIIASAGKMMALLGDSPYDFVRSATDGELKKLHAFVHRTFNGDDLMTFVLALRHLYEKHGGPEEIFASHKGEESLQNAIHAFRNAFFEIGHLQRTRKHVSDPHANSAAKRINMFLRWMVRRDNAGVDFGIWKSLSPAALSCPLDVHSGNIARKLGLLERKQNDAKALAELDAKLRALDPTDPVKYDFALFGLGAFEGF
jgi:uncharacterized protein (TIGR02757 family)